MIFGKHSIDGDQSMDRTGSRYFDYEYDGIRWMRPEWIRKTILFIFINFIAEIISEANDEVVEPDVMVHDGHHRHESVWPE